MSNMTSSEPAISLESRFKALGTTLLGEALEAYSRHLLHPDSPTGRLSHTLEKAACAFRSEIFRPLTEWERRLQATAPKLLDLSEKVLNDQKNGLVTNSSVELAKLVKSFRS